MQELEVSDTEVDELQNALSKYIDKGTTKFRGMTYEQGIQDAIDWLLGRRDDLNLLDEYDEYEEDGDGEADEFGEDEDEEEDANL